jgi:drug/metabolite transporter (DMT)-like permease
MTVGGSRRTPPVDKARSRWAGLGFLVVTAAGWAMNFTMMKILLRDWPPLFSRGFAGTMAAILLAIAARAMGQPLSVPRTLLPRIALTSFTNVFAWMGFSTLALRWLNVGATLLLVYTMPIWATLLAWPMRGTRPTARNWLSLALGCGGVVILMLGTGTTFGAGQFAGIVLALGAAVLFAFGTVLDRTPIPMPFVALTAWQVGLSCVPMALLGLALERTEIGSLSTAGLGILGYMIIVAMGLCYLSWFAAVRVLPAATAATGMLSVPVLGVVFAAIVLGEPFGPRQVAALTVTLAGVAIAMRPAA